MPFMKKKKEKKMDFNTSKTENNIYIPTESRGRNISQLIKTLGFPDLAVSYIKEKKNKNKKKHRLYLTLNAPVPHNRHKG